MQMNNIRLLCPQSLYYLFRHEIRAIPLPIQDSIEDHMQPKRNPISNFYACDILKSLSSPHNGQCLIPGFICLSLYSPHDIPGACIANGIYLYYFFQLQVLRSILLLIFQFSDTFFQHCNNLYQSPYLLALFGNNRGKGH